LKIVDVKKLDDGISGITIEGKIIKTPGNPRDSQYGWSQMVVLKDDTGEISSWINIESAEDAYKVGQYIKVQGKVSKYVKGGKPGISLNNGKVVDEIIQRGYGEEYAEEKDKEESVKIKDVSQEKPINQPISQPVKPEKDMDKVWEDKDLRMARESALKNIADYVGTNLVKLEERFKYAQEDVDFIYNGLEKITSEAITKELGGTAEEEKPKENPYLPEGYKEEVEKAQRIAKAQEIANPDMATKPQKDMVEKIIKSRYITKEEVAKMQDLKDLTKVNANRYISYWFGDGVKVGERAGREMVAQEEEAKNNPFITEKEPIEKVDKNDDSSLSKDLLIEKINKLRKENALEDDAKFTKELGCNAKFNLWTEKELTKLKEKLEIWKPNWVKE